MLCPAMMLGTAFTTYLARSIPVRVAAKSCVD